jgi:hypothetical protein
VGIVVTSRVLGKKLPTSGLARRVDSVTLSFEGRLGERWAPRSAASRKATVTVGSKKSRRPSASRPPRSGSGLFSLPNVIRSRAGSTCARVGPRRHPATLAISSQPTEVERAPLPPEQYVQEAVERGHKFCVDLRMQTEMRTRSPLTTKVFPTPSDRDIIKLVPTPSRCPTAMIPFRSSSQA